MAFTFKELAFRKNEEGTWEAYLGDERLVTGAQTRNQAAHLGKVELDRINAELDKVEETATADEVDDIPAEDLDKAVADQVQEEENAEFEAKAQEDLKKAYEVSKKQKGMVFVMSNGKRTDIAKSEAGKARHMKYGYWVAAMFQQGEQIPTLL